MPFHNAYINMAKKAGLTLAQALDMRHTSLPPKRQAPAGPAMPWPQQEALMYDSAPEAKAADAARTAWFDALVTHIEGQMKERGKRKNSTVILQELQVCPRPRTPAVSGA